MKQACGCCAGSEILTPVVEANRPGLPAIAYRAGTYGSYFATMIARLSSLYLDVAAADGSGTITRLRPLANLGTRAADDPSIALLDAWALVADVLTFYQERIANEGYLMTASERRSVLELARLVGYSLRPGVSASVFLAFTVANGFAGTLPAGARAQSQPGTGETAQFFETSADLGARDVWNALQPRLTRPQVITLSTDPGTDAATRDTFFFQGISTNLKTGDALLIVLGDGTGQQVVRFVDAVVPQADQGRTEVSLQPPPFATSAQNVQALVQTTIGPFIDEVSSIFADSDLAASVAESLNNMVAAVNSATDLPTAASYISALIPTIQAVQRTTTKRKFSRVKAWTTDLLTQLAALVPAVLGFDGSSDPNQQPGFKPIRSDLPASGLAKLVAIADTLAQPPSLQPANALRLTRTVARTFSPQADTAARLLAAFKPRAAANLYQAWSGVESPASQVQVYAFRVKAPLYGNNAPQQLTVVENKVPTPSEWPYGSEENNFVLSLDANYDKILPGSWVAINSPTMSSDLIVTQATQVGSASRSNYGMAARVTQVSLNQAYIPFPGATGTIAGLRQVTVWAQPEPLDLAEEPLDTDVEGDTIELAELYDGFEAGRWIIISGERTDIPNTTGVTASELVMISAVNQGTRAPLCAAFPANYVPFTGQTYTTDANGQGDRLVVGELAGDAAGLVKLRQVLPQARLANQQFCDQVQLAPGLYVSAYVPSSDELVGKFPDFEGLLADPQTGTPYPGGIIPSALLGQVFAWRISSAPVHTILTLANSLAYKYDSVSVTIYGNVVKATHGQTVGEILGDGDGSQVFQSFALGQKSLTYLAAATPAGAESTLTVRVNDIAWDETPDLFAPGPADRDYITRTDDSGQTSIVFGNGSHGARLPTGSANVKAVYRYGIGSGGNVDAGLINQLATHPQGAQGVINPLAASGGADTDSIGQARANTPVAVMALDRLVSVQDYADFARSFAGIGKATSVRLSDGRRQIVHVTLAGAGDIPIDPTSDLYQNLLQALHRNGDTNLPVQVAMRRLKLLVIAARISLLAGYQWETVVAQVSGALLAAYAFEQRQLGQSAFLSEAIGIIQAVPGVSYVDMQTFDGIAENVSAAQLAGLAGSLSLNNFVEAGLARVDPGATDPARRILPAELVMLTPAIPGTLILTEIDS